MDKIGRYSVTRSLGHGGMGEVFLARDPELERDVALKLLHRDPTRAGLRREARALAALNHPGIVTIYEIDKHDGREFIAMEYLRGTTLRQLLLDGATSRAELLAICAKVAEAVSAAHAAEILHRDIKPENILVGDDGRVKVVDFGIAGSLFHAREHEPAPRRSTATPREIADTLTRSTPVAQTTQVTKPTQATHTMFGTPAYMAPELLLGRPSTTASDVYSLGVVVHECIRGRRPHDATDLAELISQITSDVPARLADPLADLVERMLARAPEKRPDLETIARELVAVPEPAKRRSRGLALVAGAALAIAVAAVAWRVSARDEAPPPPAPVAAAPVSATIAFAPIELEMFTYGNEPPSPTDLAQVLADVVGSAEGASLRTFVTDYREVPKSMAVGELPDDVAVARAHHADRLAKVRVVERDRKLHVELALKRLDGAPDPAPWAYDPPGHDLAAVADAVAAHILADVAPAAKLRADNAVLARELYAKARRLILTSDLRAARPYLEQSLSIDPRNFEALYDLVLVLSWMDADEDQLEGVLAKASAVADKGPRGQLLAGITEFLHGNFAQARALLEPVATVLEDRVSLTGVHYYLGEANWHDGRHEEGVRELEAALAVEKNFRPAAIHISQYAVVRRDERRALAASGFVTFDTDEIEFALGHYDKLAHGKRSAYQAFAKFVVGEPVSPELETTLLDPRDRVMALIIALARATGDGDEARARELFERSWEDLRNQLSGGSTAAYARIEIVGEIALVAGMAAQARELVAGVAERKHMHARRVHHRLGALTAALLGDGTLAARTNLSAREARLDDAADAELAGDRAGAAQIYGELIANPTYFFDYPERAQRLRLLRAQHRTADAEALCADTMRPAVFRYAFLPFKRLCQRPSR